MSNTVVEALGKIVTGRSISGRATDPRGVRPDMSNKSNKGSRKPTMPARGDQRTGRNTKNQPSHELTRTRLALLVCGLPLADVAAHKRAWKTISLDCEPEPKQAAALDALGFSTRTTKRGYTIVQVHSSKRKTV